MVSLPAAGVTDSPEGLVRLAVGGDEAAFARIVRLHHADMVRVCFVVRGDPDVAEEAVASAWPIAWKRLQSLREPDRLRPWLCTVAANEARQLRRHRRSRTIVEIAMAAEDARTCRPDLRIPGGVVGFQESEQGGRPYTRPPARSSLAREIWNLLAIPGAIHQGTDERSGPSRASMRVDVAMGTATGSLEPNSQRLSPAIAEWRESA
jgi:Sigma-70 region 2